MVRRERCVRPGMRGDAEAEEEERPAGGERDQRGLRPVMWVMWTGEGDRESI